MHLLKQGTLQRRMPIVHHASLINQLPVSQSLMIMFSFIECQCHKGAALYDSSAALPPHL
jgi:hypothetical protein